MDGTTENYLKLVRLRRPKIAQYRRVNTTQKMIPVETIPGIGVWRGNKCGLWKG
jgi:hypothetical protein